MAPPTHGVAEVVETMDSTNNEKKDAFVVQERQYSGSYTSDEEMRLKHTETAATMLTTFDAAARSNDLYRDGELVLMPAPTQDPRDPLNMPTKQKVVAMVCLCLFGALAAAAELILGAMLPVFALEYAGLDPKILVEISNKGGLPAHSDPLKTLSMFPNSPPIWKVYLLASLPVLIIGLANLVLIPMAITVGRRPVVLVTGVIALAGAVWAGNSHSLSEHILARCVQAVGAGTVESLIPFIIQDMVHVHQRNTWISGVFALQGMLIIGLGAGTPQIIYYLSWRWVYFITAGTAFIFLIGVFFFMPETRWHRTRDEMNGIPRDESKFVTAPRSFRYNISLIAGKCEWQKGWHAFLDTLYTFFYPQIFFITMLNSAMIACAFAAGYTASPALMTAPWSWSFFALGASLVPIIISAIATAFITGGMADWIANKVAQKRGKRVPENQLLNLIFPTICALVGSVIFGIAGQNQDQYHWAVFLFGLGLMAFGFLGANTIGAVYVLEVYPHLAGPSLVNIASFRCLLAFVLSFKVSEWVADLGYLNSFSIYTGIMGFFTLLIPVVYYYGPSWRERWPAARLGDNRYTH